MSLKKQVKEMKIDMVRKEEELETYKRSVKQTKMIEHDIELKAFKDECTRLRHLLEDTLRNGGSKEKTTLSSTPGIDRSQILEKKLQEREFMLANARNDAVQLSQNLQKKQEEIET